MPLDSIVLDQLTEAHLQRLIEDREQESKFIEFKSEIPGSSYEDRKNFLAGVTSFANSAGGDLIYGIEAPNGVAQKILGLQGDLDQAVNRLENLLRMAVQPRLAGYSLQIINLANGKKMLVVRIPRSWSLPHRVTLEGHDKFYGRNSGGKYPLDVPELRTLFLQS